MKSTFTSTHIADTISKDVYAATRRDIVRICSIDIRLSVNTASNDGVDEFIEMNIGKTLERHI